jgi:hypothetical protein
MKTVFLDSNVILDAILDRSGAENAKQILQFGRDQQIRTEGFVHTETVDFVLPEDIAREEVTIQYDLIQKFYDETEDIWKIRFFSSDPFAGEQTVYLDGHGITRLIVYSK